MKIQSTPPLKVSIDSIVSTKKDVFVEALESNDILANAYFLKGIHDKHTQWGHVKDIISPEELTKAKGEGKIALKVRNIDGSNELKISDELKKEFKKQGVDQKHIEIIEKDGSIHSLYIKKFTKLTNQDIAFVDTAIKTHLVFLQNQQNIVSNTEVEKNNKKNLFDAGRILYREPTSNTKEILDPKLLQSIARKISSIFLQASLKEAQKMESSQKLEKEYWDIKHIIILKDIIRWNTLKDVIVTISMVFDFKNRELLLRNLKNTWKWPLQQDKSTSSGERLGHDSVTTQANEANTILNKLSDRNITKETRKTNLIKSIVTFISSRDNYL